MPNPRARRRSQRSRSAVKAPQSRLLLVLDHSPASQRAIDYVAETAARCGAFRLYLANLLPPVPPELLEFGGAENPVEEERLSHSLRSEQKEWMEAAKKQAQQSLAKVRAKLREAGVVAGASVARFSDPLDRRSSAEEVLEMARRYKCRTIVLGHQAHSWFRQLIKSDLAEELVRRGRGFSFWIVE